MHRIDGINAKVALPTPEAVGDTVGYFGASDDPPFTQVTGDWLNAVQEEIAKAIENSGLTLDKTETDQLYTAIKTLGGRTWYRSIPLGTGASVYYTGGDAGDCIVEQKGNLTRVARVSSDPCGLQINWPVPTDIRGISVEDFEFRLKLVTAFDGTAPVVTARLTKVNADGTTSSLGSLAMNGLSTGSWLFKTMGNFSISPFVPAVQQGLYLQVEISVDGATAGEIQFQLFTLVLEEGHE